jgi:N-acetylglucosaminyl-diphospho-decaprenol L-rhamnosyltransferase
VPGPGSRVAAVVVDHNSGDVLAACVRSLVAEGCHQVVVVENGDPGAAVGVLAADGLAVAVIGSHRNLGYGAGANRGIAATTGTDFVLVANPDLSVHPGSIGALVEALDAEPAWAIAGPRILTPEGARYPSVRRFPSMLDAAGHALVSLFRPDNPFTRRYRAPVPDATGAVPADWVSGACFLARRRALEELGGFDESYFMFAEDMDLCWRAHQAGYGVGFAPEAVVTHIQGVSTSRHPYKMLYQHHRSALRFAVRSTRGWGRAALPLAALVLAVRLGLAYAAQALGR